MQKTTARDFDFEREEPSFWAANAWWMAPSAVFVLTVVLTVMSFPPYRAMAFAYIFAAPLVYWALTKPSFKQFAFVMFAAQAVAWTIILWWLHHVTLAGVLLLGPFVGAWVGTWYLALWWVARNILGRPLMVRAAMMLGLAALWVVIEWTRTWLFSGFPWLPLGASQWRNIVMLQMASFTGQGGIAFVLITFNVGFASYMHRLFNEKQHKGFRKRSPEFSIALLVLLISTMPLLPEVFDKKLESYVRVGLVQPDVPAEIKWSKENDDLSFEALGNLSIAAAQMAPEVIIWPEAAPPYPMTGWRDSDKLQSWVLEVATRAKTPLLIGSLAASDAARPDETLNNAAFVIDAANGGVNQKYYAKRHLVPFGEYVPLRMFLGWLQRVSDVSSSDIVPGNSAAPLFVKTRRTVFAAGMLICYEDIFPELARMNVIAGAEAHVVVTNNGWFGESGASIQHAAHSVLRAVETRRPVIRCSNSGWSGWIDEYGNIRGEMLNRDKSIYFRGTQTFDVERDTRWVGRDSFYVKHGDWFVGLCGVLVFFGYMMARFYRARDNTPPVYAETVAE